MGDSLEARISIMENIQEEFGYDIQEMKVQLARLTKLIEGHSGIMSENTCGSSSFPLQPTLPPLIHQRHPSCEPHIPIRDNVPPKVHHPNWQPHASTSAIIPAFGKVSQPVDLASSPRNNLGKARKNRDKKRLDPIPVTYTELLPKLLAKQLVALSCVLPLKPPFPKSYNPNVHCDYHAGNPGHSTEDCLFFKQQVQTLIEVGKINFKSSNQPSNLPLNFSGIRIEEVEEFVTISKEIQERRTGYTTE